MVEQHSEAIEMDVDETSESTTAAADSMITDRKRMPLIPFRMSRLAPASPRDVMTPWLNAGGAARFQIRAAGPKEEVRSPRSGPGHWTKPLAR